MVDARSSFYNVGSSSFNFKSGDISGTAANTQDDKMGSEEYFGQGQPEEEQQPNNTPFIDRSAQLRATLNSLAMMNVANVLNEKKRLEISTKIEEELQAEARREDLDEEFLNDYDEDEHEDKNENKNENESSDEDELSH